MSEELKRFDITRHLDPREGELWMGEASRMSVYTENRGPVGNGRFSEYYFRSVGLRKLLDLHLVCQAAITEQQQAARIVELEQQVDHLKLELGYEESAHQSVKSDRDRFKAEAERLTDRLIEACRDGSSSAAKLSDTQAVAKEMAEALDHMPAISQGHLKLKDAALAKYHSLP